MVAPCDLTAISLQCCSPLCCTSAACKRAVRPTQCSRSERPLQPNTLYRTQSAWYTDSIVKFSGRPKLETSPCGQTFFFVPTPWKKKCGSASKVVWAEPSKKASLPLDNPQNQRQKIWAQKIQAANSLLKSIKF